MIRHLWTDRYRHRFGSAAFLRAWAKRLLLLPKLLQQFWDYSRLISKGCSVGRDCVIVDHRGITGIHSMLSIGDETFIGRVKIAVLDQVVIGSGVCINDDTLILSASHDVTSPNWDTVTSPVMIEDHAWIAVRCVILPGVTIGTGAVVGAGSVVSKDVAPYTVVVGNPAKPVSKKRPSPLTYSPVGCVALFRAWKNA